jgi:hypothetical protein
MCIKNRHSFKKYYLINKLRLKIYTTEQEYRRLGTKIQ